MSADGRIQGSFRDPSGFLFQRAGVLYRQVNRVYQAHYDQLMASGLYKALVDAQLLVQHEEYDPQYAVSEDAYKVIIPERIPFVSYPYEWSFSQLRDAALLTLDIQRRALEFGMSLKDASAYNVQFRRGKPVFIDTLSFEKHQEGRPWVAYKQFCEHFLAPLVLMRYRDIRLNQLLQIFIDGIPLDMVSALLPWRTWCMSPIFSHIHLHAQCQKRFAGKPQHGGGRNMSSLGLRGLIDSLASALKRWQWRPRGTVWAHYYAMMTHYSLESMQEKKQVVAQFLAESKPQIVWDLGANTGLFSRIASDQGIQTIAFDIDPATVEISYRELTQRGDSHLLPLLLDLRNPSAGIGWGHEERMSLVERGPADTVLALALIHHLAIANNLPLAQIAEFFERICTSLILEFVPKHDAQTQRLLASREDIFTEYTQQNFEAEFGRHFTIQRSVKIKNTSRTVYLMRKAAA